VYQRLLARDVDEADAIISRFRDERSLDAACELVLDTLLALKRDLSAGRVSAEDGEAVIDSLRESIEDLRTADDAAAHVPAGRAQVRLTGIPGRDPLDALALELVGVVLRGEAATLEVLSTDLMTGEALAAIEQNPPAAVIVPSLPPAGLTPARQLCMRVHARAPGVPLVAARLGDPESEVKDRVALLEAAGCVEVATSLEAVRSTVQKIVRAALKAAPAPAGTPIAATGRGR
jgi:hypothetical protein